MPRLNEVCEPLGRLTLNDVKWHWTEHQERAFKKLKQLVTEAPVLKYFEPKEELTLQSDASDTGLGAVLTQNGQPIAFARRALTDAETRYTQIEKEIYLQWFSGSRSFTSTHMASQSLFRKKLRL